MALSLRQLRRAAMQQAIRLAIGVTGAVPANIQRTLVGMTCKLVGQVPTLRRKVRDNMRLALGADLPVQAVSRYFHQLGWLYSRSLTTFHSGIAGSPLADEVKFDDSIRILDEAVAEGRGVVLTSPHWTGHELVAAVINRRHPMVMFVRQASDTEHVQRKLKWYNALGVETVLRPNRTSTIEDAVAYLRVLKRGKVLAITPDLLAEPGHGVAASIFGRQASLHAGAFTLAILAKAPMIRVWGRWQSNATIEVMFDRAPLSLDAPDRDAAVRDGAQDWCRWFEDRLRSHPENWLFWLDRRWTRFLRTAPRTIGAQ